jgi:hypothetical protein
LRKTKNGLETSAAVRFFSLKDVRPPADNFGNAANAQGGRATTKKLRDQQVSGVQHEWKEEKTS